MSGTAAALTASLAAVTLTGGGWAGSAVAARAPDLAPSGSAPATWSCVAEFPSATSGGVLIRDSVGGAPRIVTFVEGKLGYRPRAVTLLGQSGDVDTNATVYAVLSPRGVLESVRVMRAVRSGRTKVTWDRQVLSTRFQGVRLLAGSMDVLGDTGHLYGVTLGGGLYRYTLGNTATGARRISATAAVAAKGWQDVTMVNASWSGRVGSRDGDVLLGVTARKGELFEQFIPLGSPAASSRHQLAKGGWNRWSKVYRTECALGRGGLLGVTPAGTGQFYNDTRAHDLIGSDIANAGVLPTRIVGTPY